MLKKKEIVKYLKETDKNKIGELFEKANKVRFENNGKKVYYRGIVEFSNICSKNCLYCGIRRDNKNVERFQMSEEEILEAAGWAHNSHFGSMVLQSGERNDDEFVEFVSSVLKKIKEKYPQLGITLSLGEQTESTYKRWFDLGAHRYLLRIETSDENLYKKLHPGDHDFNYRLHCLDLLRKIGYQVGTGVMIGLPYQTEASLADDIIFFKEKDIDMIGMGPYIVHEDTPLAKLVKDFDKKRQFDLGLKMIALTRLCLEDVNIAATTALQALHPQGRELGLNCGANIIMPTITDVKYRKNYLLYQDKPCTDETSNMCKACLERRIKSIGQEIGYDEWGDSPHYFRRTKNA